MVRALTWLDQHALKEEEIIKDLEDHDVNNREVGTRPALPRGPSALQELLDKGE